MIMPMNKQLITLYGITNCDSVKKARAWLASQGLNYQFHDFKKQGVPDQRLDAWIEALGWKPLVNSRGSTWSRLDDAIRASVTDATSARSLMLAHPSVIKRPVVQWADGQVTVGFNEPAWRSRIG
jgi:Spx/MgsR family transcriptional regulator